MASKDKLAELPLYEEIQYVPLNPGGENGENVDTSYWYPPAAGWGMPGYYPLFVQPAYIRTTEKNIPENTVALKEGAKVFASDHKHVGNIERMITTGTDNRITHFVISSGLLLKERKLIPTYWLTDISEDEVHLAVESDFLDRLPEFHLQT